MEFERDTELGQADDFSKVSIRIRPLLPGDRDKIGELIRQTGTFNEQEIQVALDLVDQSLRFPENDEYHIVCAVDPDGSLAGYICFGPIPMTDACYDLYWIAVSQTFSRRGIGGKLLQFVEDYVVSKQGRRIYVDTSSEVAYSAARSFYEKHGYRLVSLLEDFYRKGDAKMIYMKEIRRGKRDARNE